jgi:hypothetical protein
MEVNCPKCNKTFQNEEEMLEHYSLAHPDDNTTEQQLNKRPDGVTAISILWLLFGLYNIYSAYQTAIIDVDSLKYLNGYGLAEWFSVGIPAELGLSITIIGIGLVQLVTVFGLLKAKKFSYLFALSLPIVLLIVNIASLVLYLSAPSDAGLSVNYSFMGGLIGGGVVWAVIFWQYLRKPHVKAYLGVV